MKKLLIISFILVFSSSVQAGKNASLTGIINAADSIKINNVLTPKMVRTQYIANNPDELNAMLTYVTIKRKGVHQIAVFWHDKNNKIVNKCIYKPFTVKQLPYLRTSTCQWGGKLPSGGLTFYVYARFNKNQPEKIGEIFLPSKP